ncbi:hypothetical protein COLO4_21997 [Corchorus olitorius]|uniref:Uncharacterized protein n=1 Tax=Corchorus olitorius TaxID=93759 RepID=A0A1R3IPS7_9ROSI|nr:hypothetical protein COLO4_21997 [Corchorus olitorius]
MWGGRLRVFGQGFAKYQADEKLMVQGRTKEMEEARRMIKG